MDLVVDEVRQLQHVDVTDGDLLFECVSRQSVIQDSLARGVDDLRQSELGSSYTGFIQPLLNLFLSCAVKNRRCEIETEHACGPAKVRFQNLANVHT